jgi:hypothetical protein
MEEKKAKKRIAFPEGLSKEEKKKLTLAMEDLEKAPRMERKEMLKLSLSSKMPPAERKKVIETLVEPVGKSTMKIAYKDYIVEETSAEEVSAEISEEETVE